MEQARPKSSDDGIVVIGTGRLGGSVARSLDADGVEVGVAGRDFDPDSMQGRVVLLCVPDDEIPAVVSTIADSDAVPSTIGHTSGATGLGALAPVDSPGGAFSLHPLQTVPDPATALAGAPAAIAGTDPGALAVARELTDRLGMVPFEVDEESRALYHAAGRIAAYFLVTLEQDAAELMAQAGVEEPREVLAPLVSRSLENWVERGPEALTGPVARGDTETVERHREAIAERAPDLLELYEVMARYTAKLSARGALR
ncbi:MAG: Rossmann-like and DUF2520 domain-containing protein [Solirubrobacterales bacterium]